MAISLRLCFPTMSAPRLMMLTLLIVLQFCCWTCEAKFGRQKRLQAQQEKEEAVRLANLVVIFGLEIPKTIFYLLTSLIAVGISVFLLGPAGSSKPRGNRPDTDGTIDVVVVGCGLPKKGMGWFHLTQLLEMETVNVRAVVEPFFMNPELCPNPPPAWTELVSSLAELGVEVVTSVSELVANTTTTKKKKKKKLMALIAGRTHDNPRLFHDCVVTLQSDLVYLEKPGAPSVAALEEMQALALEHGTEVYIGYNKNVTPYMQNTVALAKVTPHSHVFLCHNNSYSTSDLPEVFARNPEGMLKNMAIHELAVLVTYFNVTVDQIEKFKVNTSKLFSEKVSVWKPGTSLPKPEHITDFSRCAFKITLTGGRNVSVMVDRCGGNVSFAVVKDEGGKEVERFEFPTPSELEAIEREVQADPLMMPYFFVQRGDYLELKQRVVNAALELSSNNGDDKGGNGSAAEGVATIQVGIEALKLAEYATEALNKALKAK